MNYEPGTHRRRSIRLAGYDYSQVGAYFVTLCAFRHQSVFGEVADHQIRLNELGRIVEETWMTLPNHYDFIVLDAFVVMPNHVHGVVVLIEDQDRAWAAMQSPYVEAGLKPAPTKAKRHGLPEIVRGFKTFSARRINESRGTRGRTVWQRNYYERVIRDERELSRIREYIVQSPQNWETDKDHPLASVSRFIKDFLG